MLREILAPAVTLRAKYPRFDRNWSSTLPSAWRLVMVRLPQIPRLTLMDGVLTLLTRPFG